MCEWGVDLQTQIKRDEEINTCCFIEVFNLHILILAIIISSLSPDGCKKVEIKNYKNAHQHQDGHSKKNICYIYPHHKRQKLSFSSEYSLHNGRSLMAPRASNKPEPHIWA